jgi:hypothetical protein
MNMKTSDQTVYTFHNKHLQSHSIKRYEIRVCKIFFNLTGFNANGE